MATSRAIPRPRLSNDPLEARVRAERVELAEPEVEPEVGSPGANAFQEAQCPVAFPDRNQGCRHRPAEVHAGRVGAEGARRKPIGARSRVDRVLQVRLDDRQGGLTPDRLLALETDRRLRVSEGASCVAQPQPGQRPVCVG